LNFLSIESATNSPSIALYSSGLCIDSCFLKKNSSELPSKVKEIISNNNFEINNLDCIAITIGPGSYTGIRVGLSLAQGLAYSLNIPLIPVNTMDILYSIAFSGNNIDRIVGFPAYNGKLLHCVTSTSIENETYELELSDINLFNGKTIYGVGLSRYKDIINYKKIKFSAKSIGKYSIDNYESLCCKDIGSIAPIYLDEFLISQ
tara:strand:+ start:182 stop:793 length:612 start_codon:yes stop_codon:yes gene_type:complete